MAAPAWRSQNTFSASTGSVTANLPAGWQQNDIFLMCVSVEENNTASPPAGWTQVTGSPVNAGSGTTGSKLHVFWKRAGSSESNPTVADPGDHLCVTIHAISGCVTSGDPIDVVDTTIDATADRNLVLNTPTTTQPETLVFFVASHGLDSNGAKFSNYGWPSNLHSPNGKRSDNSTDLSLGGGLATWTATFSGMGPMGGQFSATIAANTRKAGIVLALKSASVSQSGSDTGSGTEDAVVIDQNLTETASGAESGTVAASSSGEDTGSATAEGHTLSGSQTQPDTGSGTDSQSIGATLSGSDTAIPAVDDQSLVVNVSGADTGQFTEEHDVSGGTTPESFDGGSGSEDQSIEATQNGSESSSGAEDQSIVGSFTALGDSGTGVDAENLTVNVSGGDQGSFTEDELGITENINPTGFDTSSGTEDQSISGTQTQPDTGSATEDHNIGASFTGLGDSGSGVDAENLTVNLSGTDTGAFTEDVLNIDENINPTSSDTSSTTETEDLVVYVYDADQYLAFEFGLTPGSGPIPVGAYNLTLLMGPANIYVAEYGTPEPLGSTIAVPPPAPLWTNLGSTLGGIDLSLVSSYRDHHVVQLPGNPASRLTKREMSVSAALAEPQLLSFLYSLNDGVVASGVGYRSYTPAIVDRATPLTYRTVIVDGWAPGLMKRRRVVLRKCLSVDDVSTVYTKDNQTIHVVSWATHRVDAETSPFSVIDEA